MEAQVVSIRLLTPGTKPGRPAQPAAPAKLQRRNLTLPELQANIPIELETQVEPYPVGQLPQPNPARQEALVLVERKRPEVYAELVLAIPDLPSEHGAHPQHGAVAFGQDVELVLLADDKRAVFFEWLPRRDASAMAQCTRDETTRANPRDCLQTLLNVSEQDLTQAYAMRLTDAREHDVKAGNEAASDRYRASNKAWLEYRDAECRRRKDSAPAGVDPGDYQLACSIELMRRRLVDMR